MKPVSLPRRSLLRRSVCMGSVMGLAPLWPQLAHAGIAAAGSPEEAAAFEARSSAEALRLLGVRDIETSASLGITCPDVAENGAVVPVSISCTADRVLRLALLVERNNWPLAAVFDVQPALLPNFATRLKLSQSSALTLVALRADGPALTKSREVAVTLGGCGG